MAKLVGVCRSENWDLKRRQFVLSMDDTLGFIIQFPDMCTSCHSEAVSQQKIQSFVKKYNSLSKDEIMEATVLNKNVIISQLSQNVHCVGCRRSVEQLFEEFVKVRNQAMEPLTVSSLGTISLMEQYTLDPKAIYSLFYIQSTCLSMDFNGKTRKGKRCILHSIDAHKTKSVWSWQDVWELASKDCQNEITLVDYDGLHVTVEDYLRKHRFCADCKNKVMYAYRILTKEVDGAADKGYCPALYEGISVCEKERHLHISSDEKYILGLIERAEPELAGSQREQHAKTMDIAQEEVLTCLGIYLHDRLFRLLQKLKVEEKSWIILYSLTVEALRRNVEAAFERKLGDHSVEHIMRELISEGDQLKAPFKQSRRKKKKCKKTEVENMSPSFNEAKSDQEISALPEKNQLKLGACLDEGITTTNTSTSKDTNHNIVLAGACQCTSNVCHRTVAPAGSQTTSAHCTERPVAVAHGDVTGMDARGVCVSCSSQGSTRGLASMHCHSTFGHASCELDSRTSCKCCQLGISCIQCHRLNDNTVSSHSAKPGGCPNGNSINCCIADQSMGNGLSRYAKTLSLQEMLKTPCSSDDEDGFAIDEEDIQRFKADEQRLFSERQRLRQTLRQKFANMQQRCFNPNSARDYATSCSVSIVTSNFAKISTD